MPFPSNVERWRSLATAFAADAPPDFTLDWLTKESGGNRCNLTTSAGFNEVGLWQLDNGNMARAGTDMETLRNGCSGQQDVSNSPDDNLKAMSSGIDYVKSLKALTHDQLRSAGADWDESDPGFWALVRLQHAAGEGAVRSWLAAATQNLGRGPTNWDEFTSASGNASNHWVQVAAENGSWAQGWIRPARKSLLWLVGILATMGGVYLAATTGPLPRAR